MNKSIIIYQIFLCLVLCSCNSRKQTRITAIGHIKSVKEVETTFNDRQRMEIITEMYYLSCRGVFSVPLNTNAFLIDFNDGTKAFYWENGQLSYPCY